MAGIPEYVIDQVRDRTDIVEVISQYIPLKKAGRNYKAVCPFHHEKTPSFMVSPGKQIYHCFGCGAGGNVFSFVMKYERLEFPEAVKGLAEKANVAIPVASPGSRKSNSLAERIHTVNDIAAAFYRKSLMSMDVTAAPKRYLNKRKIKHEITEKIKLGYAPKMWDGLLGHLRQKGYDELLLEKSGLVLKNRDGGYFDRFRDRIIFPIFDVKGRVKGFGGRALNESQPKYMNSPETFVFNKGSHLYGLNLSWEDIRNENSAVVVEGYVDFLTPFQHGIKNIVASLGTALTLDQIRLIKRYTNNITILFDADTAGENAALRSLDLLVEEEMKVRVVRLPEGYDPDSYINKEGAGKFRELLDNAKDLFDYKFDLMLERHGFDTLETKAKVASEMLPLISRTKNAILQSGYLKRLAEALSVDEADIKKELKKVRSDYTYHYRPVPQGVLKSNSNMAENILAGLMLEDPAFIPAVRENLGYGSFKDLSIRKIVERLFQFYDTDRKVSAGKLIDSFEGEEELCSCISELTASCDNLVDKKKSFDDCINWMKQCTLKENLKSLSEQIKSAQKRGDDSKVIDLVIQYNDIVKSAGR